MGCSCLQMSRAGLLLMPCALAGSGCIATCSKRQGRLRDVSLVPAWPFQKGHAALIVHYIVWITAEEACSKVIIQERCAMAAVCSDRRACI
jgi:hypothetical protein